MSDNKTRREIVKKGIATTATVGALGSVGSAAASSSGSIYIDASSSPTSGTYYFELEFEDRSGMSISTVSGEFAWSNWQTESGLVILQGWVEPGASIEMSYEGTVASYNESETDDEVTIVID